MVEKGGRAGIILKDSYNEDAKRRKNMTSKEYSKELSREFNRNRRFAMGDEEMKQYRHQTNSFHKAKPEVESGSKVAGFFSKKRDSISSFDSKS